MTDIDAPKPPEPGGDAQSAMAEAMRAMTPRRQFLAGAAAVAGGAAIVNAPDAMAMVRSAPADKKQTVQQTVSEHARPERIDPAAYDLPRFISNRTGSYDLSDPLDNHYAWLKVAHNLGGHFDWFAQYGWIMFCPPGKPPFPMLGRIMLGQAHLTHADPALVPDPSPHDALAWSSFVTMHVEPRTLKPVDRLLNPYTGKMMDLSPLYYADRLATRYGKSVLVPGVDPKFYEQPWDREGNFSQHFYDAGDEIAYTVLGAAQKPGPQQPRLDTALWTVKRADLMDPAKSTIDCRRGYASIQKASEYKFTTVPLGDESQMFIQTQGVRTSNTAMLPAPVRYILENFKDRFRL